MPVHALDDSPTPRKNRGLASNAGQELLSSDTRPPYKGHGPLWINNFHASKVDENVSPPNMIRTESSSKAAGVASQTKPDSIYANKMPAPFDQNAINKGKGTAAQYHNSHESAADSVPMDKLLARLSEQQLLLNKHKRTSDATLPRPSSNNNIANKPDDDTTSDKTELARLKRELEVAQSQIADMRDKRVVQPHIVSTESASAAFSGLGIHGMAHQWPSQVESTVMPQTFSNHESSTGPRSNIWKPSSNMPQGGHPSNLPVQQSHVIANARNPLHGMRLQVNGLPTPQMNDYSPVESSLSSRPNSAASNPLQAWNAFSNGASVVGYPAMSDPTPPITPMSFGPPQQAFAPAQYAGSQPQSYGSVLSPTAVEFNGLSEERYPGASPWNMGPTAEAPVSYMSTSEQLNYRRLLDRNMSCNWKYIVDKIVCNNDQQASIFLQQKLKVSTAEQKQEIVQAIIDQAYPLMVNRFGNFLVQRCFEHGSPEQIIAIARAIRGNTLSLSMDAFGCHVVQKAFDCVPEEYKAIMVHELLRRIPETVIHRYACHVWQKLFELRWSDSPPQIMKYVNEALRGMWHEVALGETGSLVVQNIFENCLEEDKRACINEVMASIDVVAHGQFGNWCIQHICEHGSVSDRTRATDHVLRFAAEYSIDQYASKVVEKCLKIGAENFLDRYLDRVCEARPDRPRMPLIDIAGDQFGNYLVQYIFTHADAQRREVVAAHIRKHMVSLRGSKYGSRVAMLCCNPSMAARPGNSMAPGPSRPPTGALGPSGGMFGERAAGYNMGNHRPMHYGYGDYC